MDTTEATEPPEAAERLRSMKQAMRHQATAARKRTTPEERLEAGRRIALHACDEGLIHPFATVAAFVSMGSEIAMAPLLQALLDAQCRVLVPRLGSGMTIGWSELDDLEGLRSVRGDDGSPNTRRPQEPDSPSGGPDTLSDAELIIVPAFAVDPSGIRLGRGGGWYDRALEYKAAKARVVAICWPWRPQARRYRTSRTTFPSMRRSPRTGTWPFDERDGHASPAHIL